MSDKEITVAIYMALEEEIEELPPKIDTLAMTQKQVTVEQAHAGEPIVQGLETHADEH